ncbi:MAG: outer membrane beta-barrel protein [Chthoniobacteraceae bacterium]
MATKENGLLMRKVLTGALLSGVVWMGFTFIVPNAQAQDYFRKLEMPADLAPVEPPTPEEEDHYNMALGPVRFNVAAGVGLEWNDNINLSDTNRKSDFILLPSANLDSAWRISDLNTLRFSIGVSYAKYFSHPQFDSHSLLLSPTSALAFTMQVNTLKITLKDSFSYQEDPYDLPVGTAATQDGNQNYRHFENNAGIQLDWAINQDFTLTGGYEHYNLWVFNDAYKSLQHYADTVYLRPAVRVAPSVILGVNGSVTWVKYDENVQNGGTNYMLGPFIDISVSDSTHLFVEGGIQDFKFDHNGTVADSSNANTWYLRSEITNKLTENLSQRLAFTKTTEVGFGTNYYNIYHVEYGAVWNVLPSLTLEPSVFYEHYTTSGNQGETANRYGAAIGLRYILSPSLTLSADYRFLLKDSDIDGGDYRQNLVLISIYYNF